LQTKPLGGGEQAGIPFESLVHEALDPAQMATKLAVNDILVTSEN